jgi:MinD superfamily P-loop ATPase
MEMLEIEIDQALCDHCNLCVAACRCGGIAIENGNITVHESADCDNCRTCEVICDRGAISWNYEIVAAKA